MGKVFSEYQSSSGTIPYSASHICFCLTQYAKNYIKEDRPLIKNVDDVVRDAILVDAINYLGMQGCCDFALYTKDLYDNRKFDEVVDPQMLLTILENHYANYLFKQNIVESVLINNHMNKCKKEFNPDDGALVIIDFINYIAKLNEYDKVFTIRDLCEKYKIQCYQRDLGQLKKFLKSTNEYNDRLLSGESINDIYNEMANKHGLKYISKDGTYYYSDELRNKYGRDKMYDWSIYDVDVELYAMAYAFAKLRENQKSFINGIDQKINEMKTR